MKELIKKICAFIVDLAGQYHREQQRKAFGIPLKVAFDSISLEGNVQIGEYSYCNEYSRIDSGLNSKVVIGKYCAIGRFVHITSKTHAFHQPTADENFPSPRMVEADVTIGDYVWIGDKVTILPGVSVGNYAVIAAHSVVKENVLPFEIVGGLPARHIRFNDDHYRFKPELK